ncbi:hypothetical protein [Halostella litorea]|uniref:hypothetical protein n=1 Tax=Halostella litorea TaxID=2528831 RepID=UPI00138694EC|nr:hypothetical protein [Halostella litorea]
MATRRRLAALALVLSLVLAGCGTDSGAFRTTEPETETPTPASDPSAPTTDAGTTTRTTTTADVTEEYAVPVAGEELPVDPDLTFARVQALVGTDVEPQPVTVRSGSTRSADAGYYDRRPFFRIMGLADANYSTTGASGVTYSDGEVQITTRNASTTEVERVLAHEFTHTVQMRTSMTADLDAAVYGDRTTDYSMTRRSLVEGGAVYVTDVYAERFQNRTVYQSSVVERRYERGPSGNRYLWAPYHFGYQYVEETIDAPAGLSDVYEDYPETTEQLIHGYGPDEEPPAALEVADETDGWYRTDADTKGELVTRIVLRDVLSRERAAAAAAGWGNDRVHVYDHARRDASGVAWTLRMDDAAEATEAVDAFEAYAARQSAAAYRVERVTPRTLVVFGGDEAFVENAHAAGSDGEISVAVGEGVTSLAPSAAPSAAAAAAPDATAAAPA